VPFAMAAAIIRWRARRMKNERLMIPAETARRRTSVARNVYKYNDALPLPKVEPPELTVLEALGVTSEAATVDVGCIVKLPNELEDEIGLLDGEEAEGTKPEEERDVGRDDIEVDMVRD